MSLNDAGISDDVEIQKLNTVISGLQQKLDISEKNCIRTKKEIEEHEHAKKLIKVELAKAKERICVIESATEITLPSKQRRKV